jgi:hypothetical protein
MILISRLPIKRRYCSYLLIATIIGFSFVGCSEDRHYKRTIIETKPHGFVSIFDLINRYEKIDRSSYDQSSFNTVNGQKTYQERFGYKGDFSLYDLDNSYNLELYITSEIETQDDIGGLIMQPCEYEMKYYDSKKYPISSLGYDLETGYRGSLSPKPLSEKYYRSYSFSIEKMKKLGYISDNKANQKDLCVFARVHNVEGGKLWGADDIYITSNILTYSAETINMIMVEYESLTQ